MTVTSLTPTGPTRRPLWWVVVAGACILRLVTAWAAAGGGTTGIAGTRGGVMPADAAVALASAAAVAVLGHLLVRAVVARESSAPAWTSACLLVVPSVLSLGPARITPTSWSHALLAAVAAGIAARAWRLRPRARPLRSLVWGASLLLLAAATCEPELRSACALPAAVLLVVGAGQDRGRRSSLFVAAAATLVLSGLPAAMLGSIWTAGQGLTTELVAHLVIIGGALARPADRPEPVPTGAPDLADIDAPVALVATDERARTAVAPLRPRRRSTLREHLPWPTPRPIPDDLRRCARGTAWAARPPCRGRRTHGRVTADRGRPWGGRPGTDHGPGCGG